MTGHMVPARSGELVQQTTGDVPATMGSYGQLAAESQTATSGGMGRYLSVLQRFRWMIIGVTVLGTIGSAVATGFIKPEYRVGATVWVESLPKSGSTGGGGGGGAGPIEPGRLLPAPGWIQLLKTFRVLDPVVRERHLYLSLGKDSDGPLFRDFDVAERFYSGDYVFSVSANGKSYTLDNRDANFNEAGSLGDSIGRKAGLRWALTTSPALRKRKVKFSLVTPREASVDLLTKLTTQMETDGNFLRLTFSGPDPDAAAATMNALIHRFVDEAAQMKKRKLTELSNLLDEQVTNAQKALKEAETEFEDYKIKSATLPKEDVTIAVGLTVQQNSVMSSYFQERLILEQLQAHRKELETILVSSETDEHAVDAYLGNPVVKDALDLRLVLEELSREQVALRGLRQKYTDEKREVKESLDKIHNLRSKVIPEAARALIAQTRSKEKELVDQIDKDSKELRNIPIRSTEEARLRRTFESQEKLFALLQARYEEAKLAEISEVPDIRIIDEAVPPNQPSKNTVPVIIGFGFVASLALSIFIGFVIDRLDRRFRYPDQASKELGLSILGAIPEIPQGSTDPDKTAQVVEAFRAIRLNIAHLYPNSQPIVLTITSPNAGDGKSLISSNLALSFAEAGYSTLLVDGDIRRGRLFQMFGADRKPGLLDYLSGETEFDAMLRTTPHRNLRLIPCGTRRQQGPELLGTERMRQLFQTLKTRYGVIIVDSPPLGAGIDPFVLGTLTGNLLLVLRAGESDRQLAESKLQVLDRLPIRILGTVLNDLRSGDTAYKHYAYISGYGAENEPAAELGAGSSTEG